MSKITSRDAKIRFYDGTATPLYLELDFDGEYSGPIGQPRQEEILVLNRGTMDALAHYIKGSDEALMAPLEVALKVIARNDAQFKNILDWIAAMNDGLSTQVNSNTLESTKGDTQRDGANANPAFADTNKGTFNIEYLMEMGATDLGFKLAEIWMPASEQVLGESEDEIALPLKGKIYGTITRLTSFTAGTDVEA